jgi:hypothetical protein
MGVINVHSLTTNKCHCLWYKTYHYFVCEESDTIIIVLSFGTKKLLKGGRGGRKRVEDEEAMGRESIRDRRVRERQ